MDEDYPQVSLSTAIPGGIQVQILPASSLLVSEEGQLVTEEGQLVTTAHQNVTQTLVNLGQTDLYNQNKIEVPVHLTDFVAEIPVDVGNVESGVLNQAQHEMGLEDDRKKVAEDIRHQIKELCDQLADVGEESFLISVRVNDGICEHVGSIKGDHYCLLRQEMMEDFHNFCLGIEERKEEEDVTAGDGEIDGEDTDQLDSEDKDETMEVDIENVEEKENVMTPQPQPGAPVTPRVIVLKKSKVTADHQYMSKDGKRVKPKQPETQEKPSNDNKQATSVLFLCDICKCVFNNIKDLREHKLQEHDEGDYRCDKCPRIFSLKKILERHMTDAHNAEIESENKFVCDSCVMEFDDKTALAEHIKLNHDYDMPMKCDICEQNFPEITKLMDHKKIHYDYDCFCHKCWQGFFDYLELETHIQTNCRYKEALYKCDICGKKYTKLAAINKHIDTHPIHSPHVCRMCGRGFETEKDLKYHKTAAHIVRPFKCEFCQRTFKKKETLVEHRRIHLRVKVFSNSESGAAPMVPLLLTSTMNGEELKQDVESSFECHICGIVLPSQHTLDQHLNKHETAQEEHKCDRCDRVFFSHSLLTVHCRKEHKIFLGAKADTKSADMPLLACEWEGCNKTFYDSTKWKYHMKYHEMRADKIARGLPLTPQQSSTECDICGKVLKYKSYLKAHMMTHNKEQPHQCDICGQAYTNHRRLEDHLRVHKGEKPFKCKVCPKSFTSTSLRNQHMVVHWGHKTFICDVCGKGFMSRKHFHDHMRIHNGEAPHKCETCGKDFIYYRSLVRHALTHVDPKDRDKPYKCQYCGKEYTEVTGYKHHLRSVHTGETPYQCDICGDAFHRNDKLKRHMKSRHGKGDKQGLKGIPGLTHIVTTRRSNDDGAPIIIKTETEQRGDDLFQIITDGQTTEGDPSELHVDVIQDTGPQQVFLIGLGNEGNEAAFLQETQVIEGPDGVRYIIAGSGEELQVIESTGAQMSKPGPQQVFLIGLGNEGNEAAFLQETQVIEGPDGVRYIIAGSGEELQVIESTGAQFQDGEIIAGDIYNDIAQDGENVMIMNDGQTYSADQETLTTLAHMASAVEGAENE